MSYCPLAILPPCRPAPSPINPAPCHTAPLPYCPLVILPPCYTAPLPFWMSRVHTCISLISIHTSRARMRQWGRAGGGVAPLGEASIGECGGRSPPLRMMMWPLGEQWTGKSEELLSKTPNPGGSARGGRHHLKGPYGRGGCSNFYRWGREMGGDTEASHA